MTRLTDIRPSSQWRHIAGGYLSIVEDVTMRSVVYQRVGPKSRFRLRKDEFIKAYVQLQEVA